MKKEIVNYLLEKGIKPQNLGFRYLERAIDISLQYGYVPSIGKCLYATISDEFKTTNSRIDRAIRTAVHTSNKETNMLTNKGFIAKAVLDLM